MGVYKKAVVTTKGQALLAKSIAGLCNMQFTKIAISEDKLVDDVSTVSNIGEIKQSSSIAGKKIKDDVTVSLEANFINLELTSGYYMRNIGLYAVDPDEGEILYSVSVADESEAPAGYMPAYDHIFVKSLLIQIITTVSSAENVTVEVDPSAYITEARLLEHTSNPEVHITQAERNFWNLVPKVIEAYLYADKWENNIYTFENTYPSSNYRLWIEPNSTCSLEQISAYNDALLTGNATANILTAIGSVPTVDIPIILTCKALAVSNTDELPVLLTGDADTGYYVESGGKVYNVQNVVAEEIELDGTNYLVDLT